MSLLHPWGLAALLGIPAILAIHFFRRRYAPRRIAGLFLWPSDVRSPATGRRWTRLARSASLLAELAAALAAGLLVAGPFIPRSGPVRHLTVVVDSSASMGAIGRDGRSALAEGVAELERLLDADGAGSGYRLAVVASGPRPHLLAGPSVGRREAFEALAAFRPELSSHALLDAVDLARQVAGPAGSLVVLTDDPARARTAGAEDDEILATGEPRPNLSISLARRERVEGTGKTRVYLVVRNFSEHDAAADLSIRAGSRPAGRRRLEVPAGGTVEAGWEFEEGIGPVEVRLPADALEIDDVALLEEPRRRVVRVACEIDGPRAARIERACRAAADVLWQAPGEAEADVRVVAGRPGPDPTDPAWWVAFDAGPAEAEALSPLLGPYLADAADPVLGGLDFRGVIWGGARPWSLGPELRPVVVAGDQVLVARSRRRPDLLVNLDLGRSNVHKSPAWPLFWSRLVEARRAEFPGLDRSNYVSGESPRLRLARDEGRATREIEVVDPAGASRTVRVGATGGPLPAATRPGLWVVREDGAELGRFAVRFDDASQSDLRKRSGAVPDGIEGRIAASGSLEEIGPTWLWPLLAAAVGLAGLANWWILTKGG